MEWVKGVEDLDIRIFRAQGIVGVGVTTRTCIASCPPEAYLSMDNDGSVRGRSSFYR
jgi:hypothetical protein